MKILLFGGSGQLGYELTTRAADLHFEVVSPVINEVDITDQQQVKTLFEALAPNVVINSAAYTAVDKAEEEPQQVFAINADAVGTIAECCKSSGIPLIHVSTDYVFDGLLGRPLREDDPANPVSVYGRSKLAGEQNAQAVLGDDVTIVRTQALFGQRGVNFVQTMLKLFPEREVLKVVNDQFISPTWAGWLAEVILDLVRMPPVGVVHASCEGTVTWYDFAREIQRLAKASYEGATLARIEPTTTQELNRPARRPVFSAFDTSKLSSLLQRPPISWQRGLENYLREVGAL